jgi:hypothetical protein
MGVHSTRRNRPWAGDSVNRFLGVARNDMAGVSGGQGEIVGVAVSATAKR